MRRGLSLALSLLYPVVILLLLRRFAAFLPGYAAFGLKLYPVAVNAVLFGAFFRSLYSGQSFVEKMARLRRPDLDAQGVAYTRKVTQIWCGFFVLNGLCALALALWASTEAWTLYTGFIAYLLMGLLFGLEWLFRPGPQSHA
jgi:uncharacterized membrane protein